MSSSKEELERAFAQLRADYPSKLRRNIERFEELWRSLEGGGGAACLEGLVQVVHNVVGTANTFGFAAVDQAARELEECLRGLQAAGGTPDAATTERVARMLETLKRAAQPQGAQASKTGRTP